MRPHPRRPWRSRLLLPVMLPFLGLLLVATTLTTDVVGAGTSLGARAASAAPAPAAARAGSPNILVIETDDMRADDLRFMPATRRLIQQRGLTFANSFAPSPLCCPSRASFLTGRYSHNHGVYTHESPYGFASFQDRNTLATALRGVGYRTAMVGKYLNGYGYQALRAHHGRPGVSSLRYVPPGWTRWLGAVDDGIDPLARAAAKRGGTYRYFNLGQNVDGRIVTSRGYSSDVMGAQVRNLLTGFGRGAAPWFVWWTPVAPHHGNPAERDDPKPVTSSSGKVNRLVTPARPDWVKGRFDAQVTRAPGVPRSGVTEADLSDKPRWMQRPELNAAERRGLVTVTRQRAESLLALDRQISTTLTKLYRTPAGRRTLVVFTSDNGYYLGEHRVLQGKRTLLEPSLRVPLLMAGPGVPRGVRYDPATSIDLAPTLAAYAGARLPTPDGVDLGPVVRGGDRGWTRPVVMETAMTLPGPRDPEVASSPLTLRGLRLAGWALTRYADGEVELYDMRADPLQLENLARSPEHADRRQELLALLRVYESCSGAACAAALPGEYAVDAPGTRALTQAQERATASYYGG